MPERRTLHRPRVSVGDDHIFVGGEFKKINGTPQPGFAQFAMPPAMPPVTSPTTTPTTTPPTTTTTTSPSGVGGLFS